MLSRAPREARRVMAVFLPFSKMVSRSVGFTALCVNHLCNNNYIHKLYRSINEVLGGSSNEELPLPTPLTAEFHKFLFVGFTTK